eukprot:TRINITY_DN2853_c0_g1_i1.p1 TRINITY_DN2853_c0_g1~~TRINITY_DN2853_c0_g1_i1.p1  ORF type:complete len:138 (+),score=21.77 TRINITY_DN2853_c0_g1_i1:63-476(+)
MCIRDRYLVGVKGILNEGITMIGFLLNTGEVFEVGNIRDIKGEIGKPFQILAPKNCHLSGFNGIVQDVLQYLDIGFQLIPNEQQGSSTHYFTTKQLNDIYLQPVMTKCFKYLPLKDIVQLFLLNSCLLYTSPSPRDS